MEDTKSQTSKVSKVPTETESQVAARELQEREEKIKEIQSRYVPLTDPSKKAAEYKPKMVGLNPKMRPTTD